MSLPQFSWSREWTAMADAIAGSEGSALLFIGNDFRIQWISPEARQLLGLEHLPDALFCHELLRGAVCEEACSAALRSPSNSDPRKDFSTCCFTPMQSPFIIRTETVRDRDGRVLGLLKNVRLGGSHTPEKPLPSMAPTRTWTEELRPIIPKVARTDIPILLIGETGTGKECIAQLIHEESERRNGPFVILDLALIPETLVENALFGHVKGAFTGAVKDESGKLFQADGGTLFIDEIQNVSYPAQMKLLRFLEQGTFEPVGSLKTQRVNVRIIAATNEPPEDLLKDHRLRPDLYYRLNGLSLELPPLRTRPQDTLILIEHFRAQWSHRIGRPAPRLSDGLLDILAQYRFPGNIRELRHLMEALLSFSSDASELSIEHAPPSIQKQLMGRGDPRGTPFEPPVPPTPETAIQEFERHRIEKALVKARWRIAEASKALGISRVTLWRKMKLLGLSPKIFTT